MLSSKASDELDELLYPFYCECEGEPLEVMRPQDDDLLPLWVIGFVLIIVGCVVIGCLCALFARL